MLNFSRRFTISCSNNKGLILGIKTKKSEKEKSVIDGAPYPEGSQMFQSHDKKLDGKLTNLLKASKELKVGQARTFFDVCSEFSAITIVGLGSIDDGISNLECLDEKKENIRIGISAGMQQLKDSGMTEVLVDPCSSSQAAAEGAYLSSWSYKESERRKYPNIAEPIDLFDKGWYQGRIDAECQNWSRYLMETPANLMTPSIFAENLTETFSSCDTSGKLSVIVRNRDWIVKEKMGAFLSVSQGSEQEPKLVEVHYDGPDVNCDEVRPLVLVGKGVTFDSGGVSLKPAQGMDEMRGDMGGAATIAGAILAASRLNVKGKIIGLFPLCENLINGQATKPGDVVTARNGVTIQVDNTDAEGRLLLADTLLYGQDFNPSAIVDAATLTGAVAVALGSSAAGVYSNDEALWKIFEQAGICTGDRAWRLPLFNHYSKQVTPTHLADINNVGKGGRYGGSCTAAAFLKHFIKPNVRWAHLDIAGVMTSNGKDVPYLCQGMSGRPARTLSKFIRDFFDSSRS